MLSRSGSSTLGWLLDAERGSRPDSACEVFRSVLGEEDTVDLRDRLEIGVVRELIRSFAITGEKTELLCDDLGDSMVSSGFATTTSSDSLGSSSFAGSKSLSLDDVVLCVFGLATIGTVEAGDSADLGSGVCIVRPRGDVSEGFAVPSTASGTSIVTFFFSGESWTG